MTMYCMTCNGTVWLEIDHPAQRDYDFLCLHCGRRKHYDSNVHPVASSIRAALLARNHTTIFLIDRPHVGRRTVLLRRGGEWSIVRETNIPDERKALST